MSYLIHTPEEVQAMLQAIGAASLDELFASQVPDELRLARDLELPPALSELELSAHLQALSRRNVSVEERPCFLGGGAYDHFIPAVVDALAARGEFFTSYTPYQAEVSQGNLQAFFEYQTLVTLLTGMDVSNASLYDGASATAEAAWMSLHATGRRRVVVTQSLHPEYRQVLATLMANWPAELATVPQREGATDLAALESQLGEDVACVIVQQPNFFGCLEDARRIGELAHARGAQFVVVVDPLSLGLLARPGDYGADIVVAEGQSLGNPLSFGGPYLGMLACREALVRRMPGRIAGQTVDRRGQRCWVLTLQTREQHIRREKATSNICTNQGLLALRATIYLSLLGPHGLRQVANLCVQKAAYARERLTQSGRLQPAFARPTFKEFALRDPQGRVADVLRAGEAGGFLPGLPLGRWYPELEDCLLVAVTEKRTKVQIDQLATALAE